MAGRPLLEAGARQIRRCGKPSRRRRHVAANDCPRKSHQRIVERSSAARHHTPRSLALSPAATRLTRRRPITLQPPSPAPTNLLLSTPLATPTPSTLY